MQRDMFPVGSTHSARVRKHEITRDYTARPVIPAKGRELELNVGAGGYVYDTKIQHSSIGVSHANLRLILSRDFDDFYFKFI